MFIEWLSLDWHLPVILLTAVLFYLSSPARFQFCSEHFRHRSQQSIQLSIECEAIEELYSKGQLCFLLIRASGIKLHRDFWLFPATLSERVMSKNFIDCNRTRKTTHLPPNATILSTSSEVFEWVRTIITEGAHWAIIKSFQAVICWIRRRPDRRPRSRNRASPRRPSMTMRAKKVISDLSLSRPIQKVLVPLTFSSYSHSKVLDQNDLFLSDFVE